MEVRAACLAGLGNRVVLGTVNANRVDFEQGVKDMEEIALALAEVAREFHYSTGLLGVLPRGI